MNRMKKRNARDLLVFVARQVGTCSRPQSLMGWTLLHGGGDVSTSHCPHSTQRVHAHVTRAKEH